MGCRTLPPIPPPLPARLGHPGDLPPGEGEHFGVKADAVARVLTSHAHRVSPELGFRAVASRDVAGARRLFAPGLLHQTTMTHPAIADVSPP